MNDTNASLRYLYAFPSIRSKVNDEIESIFFNFRPTFYLLKTVWKSVFPRELTFKKKKKQYKGFFF